jgi:hypothetical protein
MRLFRAAHWFDIFRDLLSELRPLGQPAAQIPGGPILSEQAAFVLTKVVRQGDSLCQKKSPELNGAELTERHLSRTMP